MCTKKGLCLARSLLFYIYVRHLFKSLLIVCEPQSCESREKTLRGEALEL